MLSRRLQTLLNIRERAALLRLHLVGTHVQPNLQSQIAPLRNPSFSTKVPLDHFYSSRKWLVGTAKNHCSSLARGAHSSADDDTNPERITENSYARSVVANSKKAPKTIGKPLEPIETVSDEEAEAILTHDWTASSGDEILKSFRSLSCHAKLKSLGLDQEKHGKILYALSKKLQEFSNKQLEEVFQCLLLWQNINWEKCPSYLDVCMEMDNVCIKRLHSLSIEEALLFSDYFYLLRLSRKAQFPWRMARPFGKKPKKLSPGNFLHFMFLVNSCRKPPMNMYEMEYRFDSILGEFTANEMGVICMAFFKTQTPFRDQAIVAKMQNKMLEEWNEMEDISITAIMKMSRYSMGLKELQVLRKVLHRVKSRISELSIPGLVHIAHAAAFVQCHDAELIQMIIERFEKDIDNARLKDMERFCWVLTIFNYNSETPLYHKIVETLRDPKRREEIERYPKILPTTVMHLSHAGVFPIDLIQKCLDPDFLHRVYNDNVYKIGWDFFALENNVRIEVEEYKGPFLKDSIREFLAKKYTADVARSKDKAFSANKLAMEVAHVCKLAVDSDTGICIDQVLPHFVKPDIILCLDDANNSIAPEPILSKMPTGSIKYAPQQPSNLRWYAIVLATQNQLLRETNTYIGLMSSKIRLLKKIGYTPIVVPFTEWRELQNLAAKENYLKNALSLVPKHRVPANAF